MVFSVQQDKTYYFFSALGAPGHPAEHIFIQKEEVFYHENNHREAQNRSA